MKDEEAIRLVKKVFEKIEESETIENLEKIQNQLQKTSKNKFYVEKFPEIKFCLTSADISTLISDGIIDENFNFTSDFTDAKPITKLFYSILWKRGDLQKIKHIIKGISDTEKNEEEAKLLESQDDALVFYHFGKYLSDKSEQPIIDQHVIRAFSISCLKGKESESEIDKLRKVKIVNKQLIENYKKWIRDLLIVKKEGEDFAYQIDKVLFATGKTIKLNAKKSE